MSDPAELEAVSEEPIVASRDEELQQEDLVVVLSAVPERIADVTAGLDEEKLDYRHGPAFPSLRELIEHLAVSGTRVDALLRHAHLDHQRELDVRAAIDPQSEPSGRQPATELVDNFHRVRRRTIDMLRGLTEEEWGHTVQDPHQGSLTMVEITRQITHHEAAHLAQLRNLIALLPEHEDLGPVGARRAPRARLPLLDEPPIRFH